MKICPECLEINQQVDTCKSCGFPFDIKILGKFEDHYFYEIIYQYNTGDITGAKVNLEEIIKEISNTNLNILSKKIKDVDKILLESDGLAQKAKELLSKDKIEESAKSIDLALSLVNCQEYIEIKDLIIKREEELRREKEANKLFEEGLNKIYKKEIKIGINLLKKALDILPNHSEYKSIYENQISLFLEEEINNIAVFQKLGENELAYKKVLELTPYYSIDARLIKLKIDLEKKLERKKQLKTLIIYSIFLISFSVFGYLVWSSIQENSIKSKNDDIDIENKNSPSDSIEKKANLEPTINNEFFQLLKGSWCNNMNSSVPFTHIGFYIEYNSIVAKFSNGGPFQESYKVEVIDDKNFILLFDYVDGTNSFNSTLNESNSSNCKNTQIAECKLISDNQIKITTFKNDCSYIEQESTFVLSKLNEDEDCATDEKKIISDDFKVNSEKAYFYSEPNLSFQRNGYLVKGESGKSLTKYNEFIYVVFTNVQGITSEGWLYSKDLELISNLNENNLNLNDSLSNDIN